MESPKRSRQLMTSSQRNMSPEIRTDRIDSKVRPSAGSLKSARNKVGTQHIIVIPLSCTHSRNFLGSITVARSAIHTRAPQISGTNNSLIEKSNDKGAVWLNLSVSDMENSLACHFK